MAQPAVPIGAHIKIAVPLWERLPEHWPDNRSVLVELTAAEIEPDGTWLLTVTRINPPMKD